MPYANRKKRSEVGILVRIFLLAKKEPVRVNWWEDISTVNDALMTPENPSKIALDSKVYDPGLSQ